MMEMRTKQEYIDFFTRMDSEDKNEPLEGMAVDEVTWWAYDAIYKDKVFTEQELEDMFPDLLVGIKQQTDRTRFIDLCRRTKREGIEELLAWLDKTDFYTAPASSKYHGAFPGGLLKHSLNVYDELQRLLIAYPEIQVPTDSAIIAPLLHDLCKVDFYATEKRNRKNDAGLWESYDYYTINEKFCYGGHGSKSVFLAQHFIKLTIDEAVAINCHMGFSDGDKYVGNAYEQRPFAWLLHVADEAACYIKESTKE